MQTPDPTEAHTDEAMARITQHINRSAGQHLRAVRRVRAGQPVALDTQQLQDTRAIQHFGSASQAAPCPPGFCGFDPKCSDWACHGHLPHITQSTAGVDATEAEQAEEAERGMHMLGWALVALAVTCSVMLAAFFMGMHMASTP